MLNRSSKFLLSVLLLMSSVFMLNVTATASDLGHVIEVKNLAKLAKQMKQEKKGLLLMLHAEGCHFCEALEENLLYPMVKSGEYDKTIFIRKLQIDSGTPVIGFSGKKIDPDDFSKSFGDDFVLTPTVLFLDANGHETTEKLIGYNTPSLYGGYLEEQLKTMRKVILKNEKK